MIIATINNIALHHKYFFECILSYKMNCCKNYFFAVFQLNPRGFQGIFQLENALFEEGVNLVWAKLAKGV